METPTNVLQQGIEEPDCIVAANKSKQQIDILVDLCVSSLRGGHANLLCIVSMISEENRKAIRDKAKEKQRLNAPFGRQPLVQRSRPPFPALSSSS